MTEEASDSAIPAACPKIFGQDSAVAAFERALSGNRLHHAWLLAGSKGVGKASFAHLAAHALLSGRATLGAAENDAAHARMAAGNEPRLIPLIRTINEKTGKLRTQISVEQVRTLRRDLSLSADRGDWRCVIVDAAEDMNVAAANALLKLLEEPPALVAFFLVSHAPGRLLPTIRSRCRRLEFALLDDADLSAAIAAATGKAPSPDILRLADGSAAKALRMSSAAGEALAKGLRAVLSPLPSAADRAALHALADSTLGPSNPDGFAIASELLISEVSEVALACVNAQQRETQLTASLEPEPRKSAQWAGLAHHLREEADKASALNLDPRQSLLDMICAIERVARDTAA